jgi:hypothetical protein
MNSENKIDNNEQAKVTAGDSGTTGRRRFVRGVAAIVPVVVLTAGSRSALATTCLSPSASASINLLHSRPNRPNDGMCQGRSPGYWYNAADNHGDQLARTTRFDVIGSGFSNKTIEDVIGLTGQGDASQFGAHIGAAYCNLTKGWVTVVSMETLREMWRSRDSGYYPVSGSTEVVWYKEQMKSYLVGTFSHFEPMKPKK